MGIKSSNIKTIILLVSVLFCAYNSYAEENPYEYEYEEEFYTDSPDVELPPVITPSDNGKNKSIDLGNPSNIKSEVYYDPVTKTYKIRYKIGDKIYYRNPMQMRSKDYLMYDFEKSMRDYWRRKLQEEGGAIIERPELKLSKEEREKEAEDFDPLKYIHIKPQGSAEIKLGVNTSRTDNPQIPVRQRKITTFDFDQTIQLSLVGNIADRIKINWAYNTEATFDFENITQIKYEGHEDDIVQRLEAGNVSFPLRTSLIAGSQNLFGVGTSLKFGRLTTDLVYSQQRGERKEIEVKGGAQTRDFEVSADRYEANKHYFLNFHHRENYDNAMRTLPVASSGIQITRIEVWVTNRLNDFDETRNIVAFSDLGEFNQNNQEGNLDPDTVTNGFPSNYANELYRFLTEPNFDFYRDFTTVTGLLETQINLPNNRFVQGENFEKLENARMLSSSEYSYNAVLGYISLNQSLNNDEVLAVAYEYTYQGQTYKVGEFSTDGVDGQKSLFLKLLKGTLNNTNQKIWDLMMKNVYAIGAYQVSSTNFRLNLLYNNPANSANVNYIPQNGVNSIPLVQLVDLDRLNPQNQAIPDGVFDFIPISFQGNKMVNGGTINPRNGRIYFNTVEPFGSYLAAQMAAGGVAANTINEIAFQELYDSSLILAQQVPEKNRFTIKGQYESTVSSEISLNAFNIPEGSVMVTAGGITLTEGVDYTVDYNLGRVSIINDGILQSGAPIKISLESNTAFNFTTRTYMGAHFNYKVSKDFNLGATVIRLRESPPTQKVDIGFEPIANTMLGFNLDYRKEVPLLTKLTDKIPLINTKAPSYVTANFEFAYLIPGHNKLIGKGEDGASYIDDFEGSQSSIDIRSFNSWVLASVPQGQPNLFPEASQSNNLSYGFNRAKLAWYVIDPTVFFQSNSNIKPPLPAGTEENNLMREVLVTSLFPQRQNPTGTPANIAVFDLAYYPSERGPYNYDTSATSFSRGLDNNGLLNNPETRWAGIMRQLNTNNFEQSNIEFIQFWVMDPFATSVGGSNVDAQNTTGGDLYFNLGNVSEDILRDGRKSFENGLSRDGNLDPTIIDETNWGRVPTTQSVVNAFDNDVTTREHQDVGLDGIDDEQERDYYLSYINWINNSSLTASAKQEIFEDPSADDYNFYRDDDYDDIPLNTLERYKEFNGLEGNSPTDEQSQNLNGDGYPTSKTTLPDIEDINQDNNLSETEAYFQYKVSLRPQDMVVGTNYITDITTEVDPNSGRQVNWYQFRIPVREPDQIVNGIQDFRSIRFMRMFMKDFSQEVVLRFARLELIRGEWRRYEREIVEPGPGIITDPSDDVFNIAAVNIEQNASRDPINYKVPEGIVRQQDVTTQNQALLNEQSLSMSVCGLDDGTSRAAFRNLDLDLLNYKRLKMFVHGEARDLNGDGMEDPMTDHEVVVFIRLGTDFEDNYYEYEIPVKLSRWFNNDESNIWPDENDIEIVFQELKDLKVERNNLNLSSIDIYSKAVNGYPNRRINVKGNPSFQGVKTIMLGVRNPAASGNSPWKPDKGGEVCAEIWFNELRLTDFDQEGGWATKATIQANLGDFANVSLAGSYSTPGFGSVEKSVSERQRETYQQVDASTTIQMGKFFGDNSGVILPLYLGYSQGLITPQYDPLNPDVETDQSIEALSEAEKTRYKRNIQDITERRSLNLANIQWNKQFGQKAQPWDIGNFSFNYSFIEIFKRDINTEFNTTKNYNGGMAYSYSNSPKSWKPFLKSKLFKSSWLDLIQDFNLNLGPKNLGFRTNIQRSYNEFMIRPVDEALVIPQYTKTFNWNRTYDFKYDISQSLALDFTANNRAIIDEPAGVVNKKLYREEYENFKDTVWNSIRNFGTNINYQHSTRVTYQWPLKKIPALNWMTLSTSYTADYEWQRAPLSLDSIGHTIQNSREIRWNGRILMNSLYDKVPYLKKINQKARRRTRNSSVRRKPTPVKNPTENDTEAKEQEEAKKKKEKKASNLNATERIVSVLMGFKDISLTYSTTDGIVLPGYNRESEILGMQGFNSPGADFVFGGQQAKDIFGNNTGNNFALEAARNDWLVKNPINIINQQYTVNHKKSISLQARFEPFRGFNITFTADQSYTENLVSNILFIDSSNIYELSNPVTTGSFTNSIWSFKTAFSKDIASDNYNSQVFKDLLANRVESSNLYGDGNPNSIGQVDSFPQYRDGYGPSQQNVLINAFIAAYTGKDPSKVGKDPFKQIPLPNWRLTYNGLARIPALSKLFRSITLSHGYRSNFAVASFTTNLDAVNAIDANGNLVQRNESGDFIEDKQIVVATINEQFSPLIGFDASMNNGLRAKVEIRRTRNISLSLVNNQITEIKSNELIVGSGYTFKKVQLPFKIGKTKPVSPVNVRFDLSFRENNTIIRKIIEEQNQLTGGQRFTSIKFSADYVISRFNIRAYYDRTFTRPFTSLSFPTGNSNFGFAIRFNLF